MAEWSVKPEWKKSIIERNYLHKDGQQFVIETGWRWGEFIVYTDDDNPPDIESGVDIYNCDYETELVETNDGCWEEHDYDDVDDETREWLEEFFDEGNSWLDLEEHGWTQGDCEMIIDCDLIIERLDVDDSSTEVAPALAPIVEEHITAPKAKKIVEAPAKWPFPNTRPIEGPEAAKIKNSEPEVTDWFPASIHPIHEGFYECDVTIDDVTWPFPGIRKLEWCNKNWWDEHSNIVKPKQIKQWRGLVKNPRAN